MMMSGAKISGEVPAEESHIEPDKVKLNTEKIKSRVILVCLLIAAVALMVFGLFACDVIIIDEPLPEGSVEVYTSQYKDLEQKRYDFDLSKHEAENILVDASEKVFGFELSDSSGSDNYIHDVHVEKLEKGKFLVTANVDTKTEGGKLNRKLSVDIWFRYAKPGSYGFVDPKIDEGTFVADPVVEPKQYTGSSTKSSSSSSKSTDLDDDSWAEEILQKQFGTTDPDEVDRMVQKYDTGHGHIDTQEEEDFYDSTGYTYDDMGWD